MNEKGIFELLWTIFHGFLFRFHTPERSQNQRLAFGSNSLAIVAFCYTKVKKKERKRMMWSPFTIFPLEGKGKKANRRTMNEKKNKRII